MMNTQARGAQTGSKFSNSNFFDEMRSPDGTVRPAYQKIADWMGRQSKGVMARKQEEADAIFRRLGITFAVYGDTASNERLIPFDLIPRVVAAQEWRFLERGIEQRVRALNLFLYDIYHRQEIIRAGRVPADLIIGNDAFLPQMMGFDPPGKVYSHIVGTDIVRTSENGFFVLEDNLRTPSGVSYMLEDREAMMHLFPELFAAHRVAPVERYPEMLRQTLENVAPPACKGDPTLAVLTPGIFNSAYFEHSFLADQMGVELVQGSDLFIEDGALYMRTVSGKERVDVLYRRVDDDYLDPLTFNPNSTLGVPGLFDLYRAGGVTIVNAPGTGIADDKAVYAYVPEIIEFYTGEKPILANVPTYRCSIADECNHVLSNLAELVVKEVHGSGGYGMLIGPHSTKAQLAEFEKKIKHNPANYIAQPTLSLSTCPSNVGAGSAPRHVDLRPFALVGDKIRITPGGLTRVALKKGSLVVNSSQGGGTKDTWVLED
jgi:uncharacterized circularly permuted ATP-grasp superfamily protein